MMEYGLQLFDKRINNFDMFVFENVNIHNNGMIYTHNTAANGKPAYSFFIPHGIDDIPLIKFNTNQSIGEIKLYCLTYKEGTVVTMNCSRMPNVITAILKKQIDSTLLSSDREYGIKIINDNENSYTFTAGFPKIHGMYPFVANEFINLNVPNYYISILGINYYHWGEFVPGADDGDPDIWQTYDYYDGYSIMPDGILFKESSGVVPIPYEPSGQLKKLKNSLTPIDRYVRNVIVVNN